MLAFNYFPVFSYTRSYFFAPCFPAIDPKFLNECRAMTSWFPSSPHWTNLSSSNLESNRDTVDVSLVQKMTAQMAPYSYQQVRGYYHGIPSRPNFVASSHTELWVRPPGHLQMKELRPVGKHKIADIWEAGLADQIIVYLTTNKIDWTSLDVVRISIVGKAPAPIILWIGVQPGSLSGRIGHNVALNARKILQDSEINDIHVEIRECHIIKAAKLLTPVNMPKSIAEVASPLTSTLGVSVCTDSSQGTGGFYVTRSGVSDKVFLITTRHVVSRLNLENDGVIKDACPGQPHHEVSLLSDDAYNIFLASIRHEIGQKINIIEDPELRREAEDDGEDESAEAKGHIKAAEKAITKLSKFYEEVVSKWGNPAERILGHVILAPPIECNFNPFGFSQDIAVIEVDNSKIDASNFLGNVIDLGTKISSPEFTAKMNPHADSPTQFIYPAHRLLPLSGVIPIEDMRHPQQLDRDGTKSMMVLKSGVATGTTIGHTNNIFSYTRSHFENSPGVISKQWVILPVNGTSGPFSTSGRFSTSGPFSSSGDSGSVIVDSSRRFGGLLTSASGIAEKHDITYATPISFILECLEDFGFKADFNLPFSN